MVTNSQLAPKLPTNPVIEFLAGIADDSLSGPVCVEHNGEIVRTVFRLYIHEDFSINPITHRLHRFHGCEICAQ